MPVALLALRRIETQFRFGRSASRLRLRIRLPLVAALLLTTACREATTGVAGTFTVTGNVSNTAGLAVADVQVEVRLIYPTCESGADAQSRSTKTSTAKVFRSTIGRS